MLLTAYNYKILLFGILCVMFGFGGMYLEEQQFGLYSLYIAPILVLAGFVLVAISVFKTDPKLIEEEHLSRKEAGKTDTNSSSI